MPKSIAVYVRVSSTKGQKTDSQIAELTKWIEANGIDPNQCEWYEDHETGKTLNRTAFNRLQKDIFSGRIKTVITWKLDRISRSQREGINLLSDWAERGLRLVVTTQSLDISGMVGRMIAGLLFALAEIELEHRRERQEAGIAVAKTKGVYQGRKTGTTIAKPSRAIELKAKGLKQKEIATALGCSIPTVKRYLATG